MKWSILGLIVVGVVSAFSVSILVGALLVENGDVAEGENISNEVQILVAKEDLPAMTIVSRESVEKKSLTRLQAPEGYLSDPVQIVGKVLTVPMIRGQAFNKTCYAREGSGLRLASALPDGMRAIGVSLSDSTGLAGLLYPGSIVDVLASFKSPLKSKSVSKTLLEEVQVLSIDDQTIVNQKKDSSGKSGALGRGKHILVTLLLDSEQAEMLRGAMESGTISLALRNPWDKTKKKHIGPSSEPNIPRVWEMTILRDRKPEKKQFEYLFSQR
ncbi:MAG: Flp pilus assembly protein CpaB [Planctomycetota bacterium]|jgi:pilus assembly protein CpaB